MFFKCKHPFSRLAVQKDHTTKVVDSDFEHINYHLFCQACGENLTLKYAKMIGGVDAFLARKTP